MTVRFGVGVAARVALAFIAIVSCAYLPSCLPFSVHGDGGATARVVGALKSYINAYAVGNIDVFRMFETLEKRNAEPCFTTDAGIHLGTRCCVFYTNIVGSLLAARFAPGVSDAQARFYSGYFPGEILDAMWRRWGDVSQPSGGVYEVEIEVANVRGTLRKCEFGTVHTYMTFSSEETDDILIDASYKQILLLPDIMDEEAYSKCRDLGMYNNLPQAFVGTFAEFENVLSENDFVSHLEIVFGARASSLDMDQIETLKQLRSTLYNRNSRHAVCGKHTQGLV